MSGSGIAALRLALARALADADRPGEALTEAESGLADASAVGDDSTVAGLHAVAATALTAAGRSKAALQHWLEAALRGPGGDPDPAEAALRMLDDPGPGPALARRIDGDLARRVAEAAQAGATLAVRLLGVRLGRLRDELADPAAAMNNLTVPADLSPALRSALVTDLMAVGRIDEAIALLSPDDERSVAIGARLLVEAGRFADVLAVAPPANAAAHRSVQVSRALAHVAQGRPDDALAAVDGLTGDGDPEPDLTRIVVALARQVYGGIDHAVARVASVAADAADVRLLRAQVAVERGEPADLRRGSDQLRKLAPSPDGPADPAWLRLQRSVRVDDRFLVTRALWAAAQRGADALDLLGRAAGTDLTTAQIAELNEVTAALLAERGDGPGSAAALSRTADAQIELGDYERALDALDRARRHDPDADLTAALDSLTTQAEELLDEGDQHDPPRALAVATAAHRLAPTEATTIYLASAAVAASLPDATDPTWQEAALAAVDALARLPLTARRAAVRGWVLYRLADTGDRRRCDRARAGTAWLGVASLLEPGQQSWLELLVWSLGVARLSIAAERVAQRLFEQHPDDASAMWAAMATKLNAYGMTAEAAELLDRPAFRTEWESVAPAVRLRGATLDGAIEALPGMLDVPADDTLTWVNSVRADAAAVLGLDGWREKVTASAVAQESAGYPAEAARSRLVAGETAAARALFDRAERAGDDPAEMAAMRALCDLAEGRADAEPAVAAYLDRLPTIADMLGWTNVILPVLARETPAGAQFERLRERIAAAAAPDQATAEAAQRRQADPAGTLSALLDLFELDAADADGDLDRARFETLVERAGDLRATPRRADLTGWDEPTDEGAVELPTGVDAALAAVLDRAVRRRVEAITLPGDLSAAQTYAEVATDPGLRRRAVALAALRLSLASASSLVAAAARLGYVAADPAVPPVDDLVAAWSPNIRDAVGWWRLYDELGAIPASEREPARAALAARLTELTTAGDPGELIDRTVQGALLGRRLVPADTSDKWVLLSDEIPAVRAGVIERTGVEVPGFRMRYDPTAVDDAVTYLLSGSVAEFTRVRPDSWLVAGYDDEIGVLRETGVVQAAAAVAGLFRTWVTAHVADLIGPSYVMSLLDNVADSDGVPAVEIGEPAQLIFWLDSLRAAVAARRTVADGAAVVRALAAAWAIAPDRRVDWSEFPPWADVQAAAAEPVPDPETAS